MGMWKGMTCAIASVFCLVAPALTVHAQQQADENKDPNAASAAPPSGSVASADQKAEPGIAKPAGANVSKPVEHRFWDRENGLLFAGVGAGRGLDYASTLNLRHRGINEAFLTNSIVDNHPLFAGIEVAATAASVGVSYLFHRTGHHRLERWTSAIHAGIAVGGAIRNYGLKAPQSH